MIIYEVNITVQKEIESEFQAWLKGHVGELLKLNGFERASILRELDQDLEPIESPLKLVVQYQLKSQADLENYFNNHAAAMRTDAVNRFGTQFKIERRILSPT